MTNTAPRAKTALVFVLILLPLILTAVIKYLPALTDQPKISAVSILPPRLYTPKEYEYMEDDIVKRLRDELAGMPDVSLKASPPLSESQVGADLAKAAASVGADALIVTTLTIEAGMIQFNTQIIDPKTKRIVFNTPYQSSLDRYPEMMRAAGAGLRRALQP